MVLRSSWQRDSNQQHAHKHASRVSAAKQPHPSVQTRADLCPKQTASRLATPTYPTQKHHAAYVDEMKTRLVCSRCAGCACQGDCSGNTKWPKRAGCTAAHVDQKQGTLPGGQAGNKQHDHAKPPAATSGMVLDSPVEAIVWSAASVSEAASRQAAVQASRLQLPAHHAQQRFDCLVAGPPAQRNTPAKRIHRRAYNGDQLWPTLQHPCCAQPTTTHQHLQGDSSKERVCGVEEPLCASSTTSQHVHSHHVTPRYVQQH